MSSFPAEFPIRLGLSDAAQTLYEWLAPFFREDEKYGQPGMKLCVGMAKMLDPVWEIVNPVGGGQKAPFAMLFDTTNATVKWIEWLAQFVGTDLTRATSEQVKREWVASAKNWQRGLIPSIKQAIEITLTGKKTIYFYPRFNGEAFKLKVAVNAAECPSEKETKVALEECLPAWIIFELALVTGGTYAQFEALHEKYETDEAKDATYEVAELNPT